MSNKFNFSLKTENIGPLNIDFNRSFSTNKTLIFANNGCGKTFLSKTFRLLDEQYDKIVEHDNLLTFKQTNAEFKFSINNDFCNVVIQQGNAPKIQSSKYIFYVFNSDYVNDVIKPRQYFPIKKDIIKGEIIIGAPSIDLDNKKKQLLDLENKNLSIKHTIQEDIKCIITEYDKKYNLKRLSDFKNKPIPEFDENIVFSKEKNDVKNTIDNIKSEIDNLKNFPEDRINISTI